jgi:hypothetical protein
MLEEAGSNPKVDERGRIKNNRIVPAWLAGRYGRKTTTVYFRFVTMTREKVYSSYSVSWIVLFL